ncbi:hypothetical protein E2C01_060153 [Portunus trituberculatus]|uniref:Uncharacterized protein n=1 Tax=Portunus trituberculatus TaxID=210409 RepID=A0A5B7H1G9_PORTR|nr:hypothetical protein [Portunus trituberculatus]
MIPGKNINSVMRSAQRWVSDKETAVIPGKIR